jgi:hypothetical protein
MPSKFPLKSHPALDVCRFSVRYMLEAKLVRFVVYWTGPGMRESEQFVSEIVYSGALGRERR